MAEVVNYVAAMNYGLERLSELPVRSASFVRFMESSLTACAVRASRPAIYVALRTGQDRAAARCAKLSLFRRRLTLCHRR